VPLWAIIKDRKPDLYEQSAKAPGQLGAIRHYAHALRETATDVLRGDFSVLAPARAAVDAEATQQRLREHEETRDRTKSAAVSAATDALRRKDYRSVVKLLTPHVERLTPGERAKLDYARGCLGRDRGAV
jgi:hypothetical protein